ncbi:hypothetical protein I552_5801 [Mycobacterium xenopi 3993]|nr:hypothetical protein I552_5801 [Mycobacterium xenopi 3993]
MLASTASAVVALVLVRVAGLQLSRLVRHRAIDTVDERLRDRGWPTILSLRLIPAVPFSVLNYAAGLRPCAFGHTRWPRWSAPPGTAAVVILGDALTGHVSPLLVLVSLCTGAVGFAVLCYEIRQHRRRSAGLHGSAGPVASR